MKKISISLIIAICLVSFISVPAVAGDKQRHRWEGVAIGVGAAILGHAILNDCRDEAPARATVIRHERRHDRACAAPPYGRGREKARKKVWVPPVYERVWNPAHYSRHGDWVAGRWVTVEKQPGYWAKKRKKHRRH